MLNKRSGRLPLIASTLTLLSLLGQAAPNPMLGPPDAFLRRGQAAIDSLATRLPAVAQANGMEPRILRYRLLADPDLAIDPADRLVYTCAAPPVATALPSPEAVQAPTSLADTFRLHSRPGATKVIYLDFNGHTTSGTPWNDSFVRGTDIVTPPFDWDGVPSTFSESEQLAIQGIWQRVAEDFSPFEVDVTTEDPGTAALSKANKRDVRYGVRVCIGGSSYDWYGGSAGGVAYGNSFSWNTDSPAFAFTAQLGGGAEKYTAEAISHEAGHTLGLSHDGTLAGAVYFRGHGSGSTGWAPIMGSSYYQEVTQWSRGEYADANNTQDDVTIIESFVGRRADDHGNTRAMATVMPPGATFSSVGIIETQTDVDVFALRTEAGTIQLDAFPDARSPNLDILLVLYDANGSRIAESNPETALSASISLLVPAGTYFVEIRPSGHGDPSFDGYSSYASLGTYVLAGQVPYIDVANDPALFIRIGELNLAVVRSARWNAVLASVAVTDLNGLAVPGATVSGIWGLLAAGTASGTTSSDGSVSFTSARLKGSGDVSFQITGVTAPGLTYSPGDDLATSATIPVGSQP